MRSTSTTSSSRSPRSGARMLPRIGTPRSAEHHFRGGLEGQRLERRAKCPDSRAVLRGGIAQQADDRVGEASGEPGDRTGRTARHGLRNQRFGTDEDVEAFEHVRLEALPGRVGHFQPDEVRRLVPQRVR